MIEDVAIDNLKQVKNALNKYNVEFWLDTGTLLGAVRDNKIISWDHDIDLGTWCEQVSNIVSACRELRNQEFEIRLSRNYVNIEKEGCPINVLLYSLINNKAIRRWGSYYVSNILLQRLLTVFLWGMVTPHYAKANVMESFSTKSLAKLIISKIGSVVPSSSRKWAGKIESRWGPEYVWVTPSHYFMNLSKIEFYGMEFRVPSEKEEYLAHHYGKDWRIPQKDWDTIRDDGAIAIARDFIGRGY